MCTAYELGKHRGSAPGYVSAEAIAELVLIEETRLIRPTLSAPVILPDGSLRTMRWGFRRSFASTTRAGKPTWRTIVNSREDKLDGPTWKHAFRERRCLIPASSFYEWVEIGGRNVPLRVEHSGGETLWIAGIWEQGENAECFSMITTEPNGLLRPVHDRMPAVLADSQIASFLSGERHDFGPSSVALHYQEVPNFLKTTKPAREAPTQGELF